MLDCLGLTITGEEVQRWDELWLEDLSGARRPSDWGPDFFKPYRREGPVLEQFREENLPGIPVEEMADLRVLEIGCGLGRLARLQLGSAPSRYVGIDTSRLAVALARGRLHGYPGYEFCHSVDDREFLQSLRGEFDLALAVSVLIHLPPVRAAAVLRYMAEVVAPGGWVSADVPVDADCQTTVREQWKPGETWSVVANQGDLLWETMHEAGLVDVQTHHTLARRAYVVGRKP